MPEQIIVPREHLLGFYAAVSSVNRQLAQPILAALNSPAAIGILEVRQGGQAGPQYALVISIADARAILDCLVNLERVHGYNAKFSGFQINFLVILWREFLKLLESNNTPKLPNAE